MTGKTAIITAASKGMGAACARELAAHGYNLVLMARSESVEVLAEELGAAAVRGSVTSVDDLAATVDMALEVYGGIDAVVANTGHPPKGDLLDLTDEDWLTGVDMMLLNVVRLARLVTPHMLEQGSGGAWVHISAFGAVEPGLAFPISSAIRSAVSSYTKLYANRYAADNIRMNAVLPGFIDSFDVSDEALATIPAGRAGSVTEIAKTVAFLLSDGAAYINGQSIRVDGSMTGSW
ncbi:MAG: SDR family oxidoreductase [Chloroflexota bacterium]